MQSTCGPCVASRSVLEQLRLKVSGTCGFRQVAVDERYLFWPLSVFEAEVVFWHVVATNFAANNSSLWLVRLVATQAWE